jgi:glutamate--cysteine ligase
MAALLDDPLAAQQAMAAAEDIWHRPAGPDRRADPGTASPWLRAARHGPADRRISAASRRCFEAAEAALGRSGAPGPIRQAVTAYTERYVDRDRCPADDLLEEAYAGQPPVHQHPFWRNGHDAQA